MQNPKFSVTRLLALTFVMWVLSALVWWAAFKYHRSIVVPIILTIFAVCVTGMYLNETK